MKIQLMSDLHREMWGKANDPKRHPDAAVVVLAGDIDVGEKAKDFVLELAEGGPLVYVPGNHEYYGEVVQHLNERLCEWEYENPNVHVLLDGECAHIDGVRFIGGTLWTAMKVRSPYELVMIEASMNDYRRIRVEPQPGQFRRLKAKDTVEWHMRHRARIRNHLTEALRLGVPSVMVSHHAPCKEGEGPRHIGGVLSAAYWTDLRQILKAGRPSLAIHGHTHHAHQTDVCGVRVVSNPRGYPDDTVPGFDPQLLIELPVVAERKAA